LDINKMNFVVFVLFFAFETYDYSTIIDNFNYDTITSSYLSRDVIRTLAS